MTPALPRPILVIGAARSGTSMVAELLARHPDVAYWVEPKYVWRYRQAGAPSDVRPPEEATPEVVDYIRGRFADFQHSRGASRFMEKTPSNCFRIEFANRVCPDGRFLHIVRDGRDAALSARRKWTSPPKKQALWRRLRSFEIPLRDLPYYAVDALRDVVGRQLRPEKAYVWGPQPPGIHEFRRHHGVLKTCAWQWRESVEAALEGLARVPAERVHTFPYEAFVSEPVEHLRRILSFLDLRPDEDLEREVAANVRTESKRRWERADPEEIRAIEPLIADTLQRLGYTG